MEISLIRHGKSKLIENDKITGMEFKNWVEKYDHYGVFEESTYPQKTLRKMATTNLVITSDLKRSVDSANLLNPKTKVISDALFRETELPIHSTGLFGIKFNPTIWTVILRLLWFSGYSNKCESLSLAKYRAIKASEQLIDYANEYNTVVLVGHGFFNMLIAKELKRKGWKGERKTGAKHWSCTTYTLLNYHENKFL
ncbi:histidine phosphatase family protein [Neobacillus sp. PS3-40]|uniref:histidine phosphatase family protein n=1 Tax=Neobacillus sp. PS3-40 TaxID=3070679 RepID=UPI0027DFAE49|nr:histidine phosphatase family protein [Neobacillus sp. PS3-40]WML44837.1 histidine phosphatase family protein [Neobacillus sp. PS3-40]